MEAQRGCALSCASSPLRGGVRGVTRAGVRAIVPARTGLVSDVFFVCVCSEMCMLSDVEPCLGGCVGRRGIRGRIGARLGRLGGGVVCWASRGLKREGPSEEGPSRRDDLKRGHGSRWRTRPAQRLNNDLILLQRASLVSACSHGTRPTPRSTRSTDDTRQLHPRGDHRLSRLSHTAVSRAHTPHASASTFVTRLLGTPVLSRNTSLTKYTKRPDG